MNEESRINTLRDFLIILFKHKYRILIIFLTTVITVTVISFLLPPVYMAKSSLIVKFGREYIYHPEVGDESATISLPSFNQEEAIKSEIQILTSRDLKEKVINTLGLDNMYPHMVVNHNKRMPPLEAAIRRFGGNLSVVNIKKSNVIKVSFQHRDPEIAAKTVNQLVENYKEKRLQVLSNPKSSFLEKQLFTYQQKLKESENSLEAFKQKHKVFSLDEQRSLLLNQRIDLDNSLKTIQNRIQELQHILSSPKDQIPTIFRNVSSTTDPEQYRLINDARSELLSLQLREQELLAKYKEDSIFVANIRKGIQKEISLLKEFIEEQEKNLVKAELSSLKTQSATIRKQLSLLDKETKALDLTEKELQILKREVATNEKNYNTYLSKLEEARISEDMDRQKIANISVIQGAFIPANPIKPRKTINIALGIIIGTFFSLGFAFFSEYVSQRLSTPESAERHLNLPVLANFSYSHKKGKATSPLYKWGFSTPVIFLLIVGVFWMSPYKNLILSRTEKQDTPKAGLTKPVTFEIQKELPSLSSVNESTAQEEDKFFIPAAQKISLQNGVKNSQWVINVFSTRSKANATNLLKKLKQDGNNAYITEFVHQNNMWYRVRIGFFPDKKDAQEIGEMLSKKYTLYDYWMVKAARDEKRAHQ